jgi:hypothetical protein
MNAIESDKEDIFDHIIEKQKQEYWDDLDHIIHPSKRKGHIVTQEEWERRQKEAKTEQKQNPPLYYSNIIHGWLEAVAKARKVRSDETIFGTQRGFQNGLIHSGRRWNAVEQKDDWVLFRSGLSVKDFQIVNLD